MLTLFLVYQFIFVLAFVSTFYLLFRIIKLTVACLRLKSYYQLIPTATWYLKVPFMLSSASWIMVLLIIN